MMQYLGNEILRKTCDRALEPDEKLIKEMFATMRQHEGIGLAANQIDVNKSVFVYDIGDGNRVCYNPVILGSDGSITQEEGCLSILGYRAFITRYETLRVKGLDRDFKPFEFYPWGLEARVWQHETDHLLGKLIIDYPTSQ